MKKIILLLAAVLMVCGNSFAQSAANRTWKTKVSDALALFPAPDAAEYNRLMGDLVSTGADGVKMLVEMLDNTNNAPVCYALSGWANFVSQNPQGRDTFVAGILNGLEQQAKDPKQAPVAVFYISLLQRCAVDDHTIEVLASLMDHAELSSPALNAMVSLGGAKVQKLIAEAFLAGKGNKVQLAKAVGDVDAAKADPKVEAALIAQLGTDPVLNQTLYYALSKTGTVASLPVLRNAASKVGFEGESTNATDSYIMLIKRLYREGLVKEATAEASRLQKLCKKEGPEHARIAAMEVLLSYQGERMIGTVVKAMEDPSRLYRNSMLNFTQGLASPDALNEALLSALPKLKSEEAQTDVVTVLGDRQMKAALPLILSYIKEKKGELQVASMWAATRLGGAEVPQALAEVMTSQEEQNAAAAQACLMAYKGNINAVAAALVTKNQDVRGLHLLAARGAKDQANVIFAAAESSNDDFAQAACEALPQVVGAASRERLCTLLEKQTSVKDPKTLALQDALVVALKQEIAESKATEAQVREEIEKFLSQHSSKATLYYGVLAKADLPGAMERITEGFSAARSQVDKDNAFYGLLNLKGMAAAETLLSIAQGSDADYAARAAEAYLQIVSQSAMTPENKVLKIEDLLETLRTNAALASLSAKLKSAALQQVEQNQCFQGLILAGGYLEAPEAEVRQAAVMAVIRTALAHKEYYGSAVTALLNQAVAANKDKDSGYQKEEVAKHLASLPTDEGFVSMFNGVDLTGWKGLIENPIARAAMKPAELAKRQKEADAIMRNEWVVREGRLEFTGTGFNNICTAKDYGNFEMYLDWKLYEGPEPDAGIYLRGTPQVQMWDTSRRNVGAEVGSGGLYNNQVNPSKPSHVADNKVGAWNTYYIKMVGDRVTVVLNGEKVVDNVILENYWDRSKPIFPIEQIELQAHGSRVAYRNLYIKELPATQATELSAEEKADGFKLLYDGTNMHNWTGNTRDYVSEEGAIALYPGNGGGGNLYTKEEFKDFVFRFEFMLTEGANNGIGIRAPLEGDAAYVGMEIQVLDNEAPIYSQLEKYQYHGSVYGVIAAKRGYLKPVGEWNTEEIRLQGNEIRVTLNGTVITEGNIAEASKDGTLDHKDHPGLKNEKGHIGFLGHGSLVKFRNIRIKTL